MSVIKIKPYGKDQGEFVLIEEENFDKTIHELYEEPAKRGRPAKVEKEGQE